jgi:hypothetical protein
MAWRRRRSSRLVEMTEVLWVVLMLTWRPPLNQAWLLEMLARPVDLEGQSRGLSDKLPVRPRPDGLNFWLDVGSIVTFLTFRSSPDISLRPFS